MRTVVALRRGADRDGLLAALDAAGLAWLAFERLPSVLLVDVEPDAFPLRGHPAVASVSDADEEATLEQRSIYTGSRISYGPAWGLVRHTVRDAPWSGPGFRMPKTYQVDVARTGVGVDLYFVDTGVSATHRQFEGRVVEEIYDAYPSDTDPGDHATGVASVAAGKTLGFATGANLFSSKVFNAYGGGGTISTFLAGISGCIQHWQSRAGLDTPGVVNMSFSGGNDVYDAVCTDLYDAGMVAVAAAGNVAVNLRLGPRYPACADRVICVGALGWDDSAWFEQAGGGTCYGDYVDVLAAGHWVACAAGYGDDVEGSNSGTSFSAGIVSGILACMLEGYRRPTSGAQVGQIQRYLREQATYGRYRQHPVCHPMTAPIAYLDPRGVDECDPIPTLIRRPS